MRALDVKAMCEVYGADPRATEALTALARETRAKGWWHAYGASIPDYFELYIGFEQAATRLREYNGGAIPGLLQARAYAEGLFRSVGAPEEEVQRRLAVRIERQQVLIRRRPAPPVAEFILGEAALRRTLPEPGAMADQLRLLAKVATLPHVTVRVLPDAAPASYALTAGPFIILDFPTKGGRPTEPTTVYAEGLTGAWYGDQPGEVATHEAAWNDLAAASLGAEDSMALVTELLEES
jgi:hypothetical protein